MLKQKKSRTVKNPSKVLGLFLLLLSLCLSVAPLWACDVPVFRWALERWLPDPYEVVIFKSGPMRPSHLSAVDELERSATANVTVRVVDLDSELDPATKELWDRQRSSHLPRMVLRYPKAPPAEGVVWSGPLTDNAAKLLLDSPKRQEVANRLLEGDSAVWVLLQSGDSVKDQAAEQLLTEQLEKMQETLEVPDRDPDLGYATWKTPDAPDLPIVFSLVTVSRADPAEQMFVDMLLHSESDLLSFAEPLAFPIFGRGRALYALVGVGITAENIEEACAFLVGACTCQVKDENPGMDMLMSVDWDGSIETQLVAESVPAPFPGLSEVVAGSDVAPRPASSGFSSPVLRNTLIAFAVLILFVTAVTFVLIKRKLSSS
jgi:hypothetical protein